MDTTSGTTQLVQCKTSTCVHITEALTARLTMIYRDHQKHAESFLFIERWPCKQHMFACFHSPDLCEPSTCCTTLTSLPHSRNRAYLFKSLKSPVAALICGFVPPPQTHQQSARHILGLQGKLQVGLWPHQTGTGRQSAQKHTVQKSRVSSRTMTTKLTIKLELNMPQNMYTKIAAACKQSFRSCCWVSAAGIAESFQASQSWKHLPSRTDGKRQL